MEGFILSNNDAGLPGGGMPDMSRFRIGEAVKPVGGKMHQVTTPLSLDKTPQPEPITRGLDVGNDEGHKKRIGAEVTALVDADDQDPRRLRGLDAITMPELMDLLSARNPDEVRQATRDFVSIVVKTDRDTFGVDYRYDTQTVLKVLNGKERHATRDGQTAMSAEFNRCAKELSTVSQVLFWMNTFSAVGKSMSELGSKFDTMSTGTLMYPDAFETFFNLPSTENGTVSLGDNIDKVLRACMVVGMCEDPKKLKEMRNRPGWKLLFPDPEAEQRFLGKIDDMDDVRTVQTNPITKEVVYDSLAKEKNSGTRVGIAAFGNIWARAENGIEAKQFYETLTKLVDGDTLAVDLALGIFKIWGLDAEYAAFAIQKDGKETMQFEGWPNSSDLAKLMHFAEWQKKQNAAGHPCGPKLVRGNVRNMLTSFPKFAHFKTGEGEDSKRSIYEQMWGYDDEPAKRLGKIEWNKLTPDVWNDWGTRINVPGGKDGGLFAWLKMEAGNPDLFASVQFWELFTLNLNVAINEQLMCDGEFKGVDPAVLAERVKTEKRTIVKNFWEGIKSLPDYPLWSTKTDVVDADRVAAHTPKTKAWQIKNRIWPFVGIDYLNI